MFEKFVRDNSGSPGLAKDKILSPEPPAIAPLAKAEPTATRHIALKVHLHEKLLTMLNLSVLDKVTRDELRRELAPLIRTILSEDGIALNTIEYHQLVDEVLDEVLGLGPLEPYLKDPTINDILVNTHKQVYVERQGKLEATPARFKDERHLMRVIQKIVSAVGRRVDESQPWVDARLPDGSRVNVLVPPCAVDGPLVSIRKFSKMPFTIERLIEIGSIDQRMAAMFELVVRSRLNVLISGGTGSGKTTLLNALSSFISNKERIITIEDTAELQLQQTHIGRMETRPPNIENLGEVTQRDLVRNALRMRPDRIIVGEVRGAEVLDMLQAMNTGHDGSMTTVHANSPRDALTRLEHMVGMTGIEIPLKALRSQVASALNVIIQGQRLSDGKRRVVSVQEIVGMESDTVTMQEIFRFERTGTDADGNVIGRHRATGIRPKFVKRAEEYGFHVPADMFKVD
ncbi:MAG TPA: CpaF family protein [Micropepsaceae bacterium]|nr:CpaF family protein [Micropepsaceae bacterium]